MSSSTADRPRIRSSTWGSIQTLTRALRESLRLRKLRKQKRLRNEANNEQMRGRSKSVGHAFIDDEISEVGISVAMASDIGPVVNLAKQKEAQKIRMGIMPKRRQSKSVDDVELAQIKKSIDTERERIRTQTSVNGQQIRRRSKDDHDLPNKTTKIKDSNFYVEQKGFRKRFGQLFGSLRNRHHIQLQPGSPTPSSASEGETADDKTTGDICNDELKTTTNEFENNTKNNESNDKETKVMDRE